MKIKSAVFLGSQTDYMKCPPPDKPEYAFIGRSNVGKSSLINSLTGRSSLAKTSATPGKTQLINHFLVDDLWYLVDLPGYGYAKVGKSERERWTPMTHAYLTNRSNLVCTFVLVDSRLPVQQIDHDFMVWLAEEELPFHLVFTKMDKLKKSETTSRIEAYLRELNTNWEVLPDYFLTSSKNGLGRDTLLEVIGEYNELFTGARQN